MAESEKKTSQLSRKQAIIISGGVLLIAVGVVSFLFWKAQKPNPEIGEDAEVVEIKVREEPVLFAPDAYEASQEELDNYEKLLQEVMVSTDTLYIENDCITNPVVLNFTGAEELRIINDSDTSHTFTFGLKEYNISGNGLEFADLLTTGTEGRNYYFCDGILSGIIILEKT